MDSPAASEAPPKVLIVGGGLGAVAVLEGLQPCLASNKCAVQVLAPGADVVLDGSVPSIAAAVLNRSEAVHPPSTLKGLAPGPALEWTQARVKSVDPAAKHVIASNMHNPLAYDYLVLAQPLQGAYDCVPGYGEHGHSMNSLLGLSQFLSQVREMEEGTVDIIVSEAPERDPLLPFECAITVHSILRGRGKRDRVSIRVSGVDAEPLAPSGRLLCGPVAQSAILAALSQCQITYHGGRQVKHVTATDVHYADGKKRPYKLLLTPEQPAAYALTGEGALGRKEGAQCVPVDPLTMETSDGRVYALGAAATYPIHGGFACPGGGDLPLQQGLVVGQRLCAVLQGQAPTAQMPAQAQQAWAIGLEGGCSLGLSCTFDPDGPRGKVEYNSPLNPKNLERKYAQRFFIPNPRNVEYLVQRDIPAVVDQLLAVLCDAKPQDPVQFLTENLHLTGIQA